MKKEIENSLGNLSGKVLLASNFPKPNPDDVSGVLNGHNGGDVYTPEMSANDYHNNDYYGLMLAYCSSIGISPIELIEQHKLAMKSGIKTKKPRPDNNYGVYDRNKIKLNKEQ